LESRITKFIEDYNAEIDRYLRKRKEQSGIIEIDEFVDYSKIKWSEMLKNNLRRGLSVKFNIKQIRISINRPYIKKFLYFDSILNERRYQLPIIFPTAKSEEDNQLICISGLGSMKPFHALIVSKIPNLDMLEKTQCFPYYIYDIDGTNRRDNITSWSLEQFRDHYNDIKISKWDIFHYIYALLHHPDYRMKYADCIKKELPRIPYAPDFKAFVLAGKKLAELHLGFEKIEPYKLKFVETKDIPLSYRIENKMRLDKGKTLLIVNSSLTLAGIPKAAFEYQLVNRSALEWIIDQYQITQNERNNISSDPNNPDDEQYIVRLVGQIISVSLETVEIVKSLPKSFSG
jgi:predicted helicase